MVDAELLPDIALALENGGLFFLSSSSSFAFKDLESPNAGFQFQEKRHDQIYQII